MLHEAIEEGDGENQVKAAFLNSLDSRREDWAQRMLRSAHILKGARKVRLAHLRGDSRLIRHFFSVGEPKPGTWRKYVTDRQPGFLGARDRIGSV